VITSSSVLRIAAQLPAVRKNDRKRMLLSAIEETMDNYRGMLLSVLKHGRRRLLCFGRLCSSSPVVRFAAADSAAHCHLI
jgi:hypothetical protein